MDQAPEPELHQERDRPKEAGLIKVRFMIALMATLCPVVCYISRQNLPFAIVSMVDDLELQQRRELVDPRTAADDLAIPKASLPSSILGDDLGLLITNSTLAVNVTRAASSEAQHSQNQQAAKGTDFSNILDGTCPERALELGQQQERPSARGYGPKYAWSTDDKGILLGAFFYSYVLFQIPVARLAEQVGAKWIMAAATLGSALFSLVSPWAAAIHVHLFSLIRVLMGICQAALYPSCYVLYAKWLPPIERSQCLPLLGVGAYVGSIVASSLTGYVSEQPHLGWEYSFYIPSVLCALWTAAWFWLAANEPREHATISIEELVYIESKMELQKAADEPSGAPPTRPQISWRKLFSSRSIWAMMLSFFASNWSFTIVLLLIPTYLNKILHVSPLDSGIINSIIYVLYCIASPLVGTASTMMVETRACGLSRLNIRKLFQGVALFGQAACFIALSMLACDQHYVATVLCIQIVLYSFVNGGEVQLPTELSVDFAGTIYAIGNCVGSSTGFIVPIVYSQIVRNEDSRAQWSSYFYLAALVSVLGGLLFSFLGQNHLQDFSKDLAESRTNICKLTGLFDKGSSFDLEEARVRAPKKPRESSRYNNG